MVVVFVFVVVVVSIVVVIDAVVVVVHPRNLPLKFVQNQVSNSSDMDDIEFLWVVVVYAKSSSCLARL